MAPLTRIRVLLPTLLWSADTVERHALVARLAGPAETILDVGGTRGVLDRFVDARVTTANVDAAAHVVVSGIRLPFGDASFDVATSIDVLEHLERHERRSHFGELMRVARRRVVLCCPLGTEEHVRSERELAEWHERVTGRRHRWLDEHLERGLPTLDELRQLAGGATVVFHGDFRRVEELFRLAVLARARPRAPTLARYAVARIRRPRLTLDEAPAPWSNRAFLIADAG